MWGTGTQGTHGREGEAGHDVSLGGKTGETYELTNRVNETPVDCESRPQVCRVAKSCARGVRTLVTEEPDVLIGHVRICGGPGG